MLTEHSGSAEIVPMMDRDPSPYANFNSPEPQQQTTIERMGKKKRSTKALKISVVIICVVVLISGILSIPFLLLNLIGSDALTKEGDAQFNNTAITVISDDVPVISDDVVRNPTPSVSTSSIFTSSFSYKLDGNGVEAPQEQKSSNDESVIEWFFGFFLGFGNPECGKYDAIGLALVYESSFCSRIGGRENAEKEIVEIVREVSKKFEEQGICMRVRLSYLEGWCNSRLDPYVDIVNTKECGSNGFGVLDVLRSQFEEEEKAEIYSSMKLLISGTEMSPSSGNSCSIVNSICGDNAIAVTYVDPSIDADKNAYVIAQSLAQIAGGSRSDVQWEPLCSLLPIKNMMCPQVNEAVMSFWGEATISSIKKEVEERGDCLI